VTEIRAATEHNVLARSKTGAFILSGITVLSFTATSAILNIFLPYLLTGETAAILANPLRPIQPLDILALVAILLAALVPLIAIGAFWLNRFFAEAYYGKRGAIRWALFGFLFALALWLVDWVVPEGWWLLKIPLEVASLLGAFFGARKIMPL
jgi:hypothetical protein